MDNPSCCNQFFPKNNKKNPCQEKMFLCGIKRFNMQYIIFSNKKTVFLIMVFNEVHEITQTQVIKINKTTYKREAIYWKLH